MLDFNTLRAANNERQAEWDADGVITLAYRGNELGGEAGEAQNVIKKLERERLGIRGSRATVDQLGEELADVVICADLIAAAEGIDLGMAVINKFNATSRKVGLRTHLLAYTPDKEGMVTAAKAVLAILETYGPDEQQDDPQFVEVRGDLRRALQPFEQQHG